MSKLDESIRERMKNIVYNENRPFSYLDFIKFTVNDTSYGVAKNTFRNKICYVFKDEVELICYSPMAFYTLKDHNFSNSMTDNHTGGTVGSVYTGSTELSTGSTEFTNKTTATLLQSNTNYDLLPKSFRSYLCNLPIYRYIKNIPLGRRSIHDIRLRFVVKGLWSLLSNSSKFQILYNSKDISITKFERENLNVKVTVHDTDTVSVSIGCTFAPVELDTNGMRRLSNALAITEDRIRREIQKTITKTKEEQATTASLSIPYYGSWIITIWHFGRDSEITYSKKEFNIEYRTTEEIIIKIYDKYWKHENKRKIRIEKQEYPNKSFNDAMEEQLNKYDD